MTRRVRRVRYREEIRAEIAGEQLGADASTDDDLNERPLNDDRPERGDPDRR
jgi:hypothetical protein